MNKSAKFQFLVYIIVLVFSSSKILAAENSSQSIFSIKNDLSIEADYDNNLKLKSDRKLGFGASTGAASGFLGIHAEINFENQHTAVLGLGTGPNYSSFVAQYKKNLEGIYLSPYYKLGYSHWFGGNLGFNGLNQQDILRRVLTADEIRKGQFNIDFLTSSLGVEYNQLNGEWAGFNFFGELMIMVEPRSLEVVPTGSVGVTYFY